MLNESEIEGDSSAVESRLEGSSIVHEENANDLSEDDIPIQIFERHPNSDFKPHVPVSRLSLNNQNMSSGMSPSEKGNSFRSSITSNMSFQVLDIAKFPHFDGSDISIRNSDMMTDIEGDMPNYIRDIFEDKANKEMNTESQECVPIGFKKIGSLEKEQYCLLYVAE